MRLCEAHTSCSQAHPSHKHGTNVFVDVAAKVALTNFAGENVRTDGIWDIQLTL